MTGRRRWRAASTFLLRQAGFPLSLLDTLHAPDVAAAAAQVGSATDDLAEAATRLAGRLPSAKPAVRREIHRWLHRRQPVPASALEAAATACDPETLRALHRYQQAVTRYETVRGSYAATHQRCLDRHRDKVMALVATDERLRDVLLVSNDAQFSLFRSWLDGAGRPMSWRRQREQRRADLFARYLQRVASKNETNSHFGPISVGRFDPRAAGLSWVNQPAERRYAFFSYWAADAIGRELAQQADLRPYVRPRRLPLAFGTGAEIWRYESTTATGAGSDWAFTQHPPRRLDQVQSWLFVRADGLLTLQDLHRSWPGQPAELADAVTALTQAGLLVAHFEVPVGDPEPLAALRSQLPPAEPAAVAARAVLDELEQGLRAFATATHDQRVTLLDGMKRTFVAATGRQPHREPGRHYADRGLLHEECLSRFDQVVAGGDLLTLITDELGVMYDLMLLAPRHRLRRERGLLADWFAGRFGAKAEVSLGEFYRGYFTDRPALGRACQVVTDEIRALDRALYGLLTAGRSLSEPELVVDRRAVEAFIARFPATPGAVCNPDLMLAASDRDALTTGEFLAVVGDCHATRELLTHSGVSPLVGHQAPEVVAEMLARYKSLLDDDELLCDVVRSHRDKTDAQLSYDIPDVEFLGRSRRDRSSVVTAADLRVKHNGQTLELRCAALAGRLRLLAPPATGPSITRDPLAVFSFPRYFGGLLVDPGSHAHLPRLRCGRVVLQRELWRVPGAELTALGPADEAQFLAAAQCRRRHGLPRRVFAKLPEEPKPLFVDFASPLLVRQLARRLARRPGTIRFTEMLPGPTQLWLAAGDQRYTCEVRYAVFG